jgi:hypothetical protein
MTTDQINYILSFQWLLKKEESGQLKIIYKKQCHGKIDIDRIVRTKFRN